MASTKLFVGGLSWDTDDSQLKSTFAQHGEVTEAKVIMDRDSGRSRGFGFVTFTDAQSAQAAQNALDGSDLDGRAIKVNEAQERSGGRRGGNDDRNRGNSNNAW